MNKPVEIMGFGLYGGGGPYSVIMKLREGDNSASGELVWYFSQEFRCMYSDIRLLQLSSCKVEFESWNESISDVLFEDPILVSGCGAVCNFCL